MHEFNIQESIMNKVESKFEYHKIIEIFYTDLVNEKQKTMNSIFDFLDIKPITLQDSVLKRQNPEPLSKLIINFSNLKKEFQNTKWENFFKES